MSEDLRFPIGDFVAPPTITPEMRERFIQTIEQLPTKFRSAIEDLGDAGIDSAYRLGGWTIRQLAHHVADSHMNSFCRFKLGLSEHEPTIKTYDEAAWAEMADSKVSIDSSLNIIDGIHSRWATLLRSMTDADFERNIIHPERGAMTLGALLALYDWHSRHHTAHVEKSKR